MTSEQLVQLRDDIAADPQFAATPHDTAGAQQVKAVYDQDASPAYWVRRTSINKSEIYSQTSVDSTTWSWSLYIARSQPERDAWREMFSVDGMINPSMPNVQQGLQDIFSGAGGAAQRTHLLAITRRLASRYERLFAIGTGSPGSPGILMVEGPVDVGIITAAWSE